MATKSEEIKARIEPELKKQVVEIFHKLGLTTTQALTLFCKQVTLNQGLPFEVKIPTEKTLKAMEDAKNRTNLKSYNSVDEMFEKLGA